MLPVASGIRVTPASAVGGSSIIGSLSSGDPTFDRCASPCVFGVYGPTVHYDVLTFQPTGVGPYTFSLNTTGFQGGLFLYQGSFIPSFGAITNLWNNGALTANPVSMSTGPIGPLLFNTQFQLVITSSGANATGAHTMNVPAGITVTAFNGLSITPSIPPDATQNVPYSQALSAGAGALFSVTSGALPSGMTLTSGGLLSGTPTVADEYAVFTVTATTATDTGIVLFSLYVYPPDATDTTKPVVSVPANVTAEATSAAGRAVSFSATANDAVTNPRTATCAPASGTVFALGDYDGELQCHGCSWQYRDQLLRRHHPGHDQAILRGGTKHHCRREFAGRTYSTPSATDSVGVTSNSCAPLSGSLFVIGTTTVTCTASDAAGNSAAVQFTVTVRSAATMASALAAQVQALGLKTLGNSLTSKAVSIQASIAAGNTATACQTLQDFINQVKAQSGKALTKTQADALIASATAIRAALGC